MRVYFEKINLFSCDCVYFYFFCLLFTTKICNWIRALNLCSVFSWISRYCKRCHLHNRKSCKTNRLFRDKVCSIMKSIYISGYTKNLDFFCEFHQSDEIIMSHNWLISFLKTVQFQSRHEANKYLAHYFLWFLSINESSSLELHLAIIAACISILRPFFRFFGGSQSGDIYSFNQRFVNHGKSDENFKFHKLNEFSEAESWYDFSSFEFFQNDSRNEKSIRQFRGADVIRKIVETDVIAS